MLKISILSPQQQDSLHAAALNVLKTTGCEIQDKKWLKVLAQGDVKVDFKTSRAFVTDEDIVNSALNSCGRSIKYLARDPKKDWIIGQGNAKTHTPEGTIYVIDLEKKVRRHACLSDLADLTKICDCLPNVDAVIDPVIPSDIPPSLQGLMALRTMIANSSKPVDPAGLAMGKGFPFALQMFLALLGDRDITEYSIGIGVTATSPLRFPFNQLDFFWKGIELGTPCDVGSMPQAGSTAPASLAGTLTLFLAESLMGIVMGQIKKPGLSQFVFVRPCLANPRYGNFVSGAAEVGLLQAAATQLCKEKYDLLVNAGWAVSDSHSINPQAAYEKCYTWLLSMLAGADMVSGIGGLGSGLIASAAQIVIDNEIIGHLRQGTQGILIDDFHLDVEMIEDIGVGGTFLMHPKTSKIMRKEWRLSNLPNRDSYGIWESAGSPEFIKMAEDNAKEILDNHVVEPLDSDLEEKLDSILQEAKKSL